MKLKIYSIYSCNPPLTIGSSCTIRIISDRPYEGHLYNWTGMSATPTDTLYLFLKRAYCTVYNDKSRITGFFYFHS